MTKNQTLQLVDQEDVRIGMEEEARANVAEALTSFLASTYTLYMKSLFYHWNVTGPNFTGLHKLFEEQYQNLHHAGDELAERVRALGHKTPGTFHEFLKVSAIKEDETLPEDEQKMARNLMKCHEVCTREARKLFKVAEKFDDQVTMDMLVERMAFHEKAAWMLRATVE